jgi:7-cyano-7-deazaguanine synthase in queuosine biosynthesis
MGEWLVSCGNTPAPHAGATVQGLRLHLDGPARNVNLHLHDISRRMAADIPPILIDLIEIAAYVFAADEMASRGGPTMAAMGRDWRRRFRFVISIRDPALWSRPEVVEALTEALDFMSEDEFHFEFLLHDAPAPIERYFDLGPPLGHKFASDEVLLFSGGMDSLCGALVLLKQQPRKRLLLVSHQSSSKMTAHQRLLAEALQDRFAERVLHVPVRAGITDATPREFTQRTRSFLFSAIAAAVGASHQRILFYENGVVSFNLPIAGQVVGTRASRTTHPRTLQLVERLLCLLLQRDFRVENPFIWKTRAEVAALGVQSGHADLLPLSVSCSRVRSMERDQPHCGACSQCIDRAFATLGAELDDLDAGRGYRIDLLTGARERAHDRTMAESYVRHALELNSMAPHGFLTRFANELSRWSRCFPGMTADEVARLSYDLHRRHAAHVIDALASGIKAHAHALAEQRLPDSCLLRLLAGTSTLGLQVSRAAETTTADRADAGSDHNKLEQTLDIEMALVAVDSYVLFSGVGQIRGGTTFRILEQLIEPYLDDRASQRSIDQCRFVRARTIAKAVGITQESLRRRISTFRRNVAALFQEQCGLPLAADSVIENRNWQGYRLNPRVRLVRMDSAEQTAASPFPAGHVTARASLAAKSAR